MKLHKIRTMTSKILALISVTGIVGCSDPRPDTEMLKSLYSTPLPKPQGALTVYHLGHSLVGRDMPAMVQQLAANGHNYHSQLGWGATLQSHWEPDIPINGFDSENAHDRYRDVFEAIESQEYDAFILTEMVEIQDAIAYFDAAKYFHSFAERIAKDSPKSRIYLYESWHEVTDEFGWIHRLERDYDKFWLGKILDPSLKKLVDQTIYTIPVGQVMAQFFREIDANGGIDGIRTPDDIFARTEEGELDPIHVNDLGTYLVALVHYAVLYQESPEGLSFELKKADGTAAQAPSEEAARLMQKITWDVVSSDYRTGLRAHP